MSRQNKQVTTDVAGPYNSEPAHTNPDPASIAARAYQFWLERGCPNGSDQEDWFRAEAALQDECRETLQALGASA
jgi:hypothetical protein